MLAIGLIVSLVFVRLVMAYYQFPYARHGGLLVGSTLVQISSQAADLALSLGLLAIVLGVIVITRARRRPLPSPVLSP